MFFGFVGVFFFFFCGSYLFVCLLMVFGFIFFWGEGWGNTFSKLRLLVVPESHAFMVPVCQMLIYVNPYCSLHS